jgi:hypothetical protein
VLCDKNEAIFKTPNVQFLLRAVDLNTKTEENNKWRKFNTGTVDLES